MGLIGLGVAPSTRDNERRLVFRDEKCECLVGNYFNRTACFDSIDFCFYSQQVTMSFASVCALFLHLRMPMYPWYDQIPFNLLSFQHHMASISSVQSSVQISQISNFGCLLCF